MYNYFNVTIDGFMNLPMLGATMIYIKTGSVSEQLLNEFVKQQLSNGLTLIDGHVVQLDSPAWRLEMPVYDATLINKVYSMITPIVIGSTNPQLTLY